MKDCFPIGKFGAGRHESLSGVGSSLSATQTLRVELIRLIKEQKFDEVHDCPCGDFNWMKKLLLDLDDSGYTVKYLGVDIQPDIIRINRRHETKNVTFEVGDVKKKQFTNRGLILVRDCFIHLPNRDVLDALQNISRSNNGWLLSTTYPTRSNSDIDMGGFRPINLQAPPFSLPKPRKYINENYPYIKYWDKSLGFWKVSDIA